MTHCVYYAYHNHLYCRFGLSLTRRDLLVYNTTRRISGHQYSDPTFGGIIPIMIKWMAARHGLWPIIQYQTYYNKNALLQEAIKEHGIVAWLLTKLAPNKNSVSVIGLHPAIYFIPGHAYEAVWNADGAKTTMGIQLRLR